MGYVFTVIVSAMFGFGIALFIRGAAINENIQQAFDEGYQAGRNSK